jgi:hypothetical protein
MQSLSELWVDLLSSKYTVGPNFLLSINPFGGSSTWSSIIFEQKTSSMTVFRGLQVELSKGAGLGQGGQDI